MDNTNKINENIDKIDSIAKMKLDEYKMSYPKLNKKLKFVKDIKRIKND